jgi:hypothetical protein
VFAPQPTKVGLVNPKLALTGVLQRFNLEHGENRFVSYEAEIEASKPYEYFSAPRILLRQVLSRKLRLQGVFTGETFLTNQSVQSLIPNPEVKSAPSLQFLLGVLNSRLLSWYFVNFNSVARRDDFPKIIIQQTRELPLPNWNPKSDKAAHDRMVTLVEQMLALHRQLAAARTPQEQAALERQIAATDTQIDRLVYDLYGLTEDEIKIVEGKAVAETPTVAALDSVEPIAKPKRVRKAKGLYSQPVAAQPAAEAEPAAAAFYNAMGKEEAPPYKTEGETP